MVTNQEDGTMPARPLLASAALACYQASSRLSFDQVVIGAPNCEVADGYDMKIRGSTHNLTGFHSGDQKVIEGVANSFHEDFLRSLVDVPRTMPPLQRAGVCIELVNLIDGFGWIRRSPVRTELLQGLASMLMHETTPAVRRLIHDAIHVIKSCDRNYET